MKRFFLCIIALATCITAIPASANINPRAVVFGTMGTLMALSGLSGLTENSLVCDPEEGETTSEKAANQCNRICEKIGALGLFGIGTVLVTGRNIKIGNPNVEPTIMGSIIGGITMLTGLRLLTHGHKSPKTSPKSLAIKQTNLVCGKLGAIALMAIGAGIVSQN